MRKPHYLQRKRIQCIKKSYQRKHCVFQRLLHVHVIIITQYLDGHMFQNCSTRAFGARHVLITNTCAFDIFLFILGLIFLMNTRRTIDFVNPWKMKAGDMLRVTTRLENLEILEKSVKS